MPRKLYFLIFVLMFTFAFSSHCLQAVQQEMTVIAKGAPFSGDQADGTSGQFFFFTNPILDDAGRSLFNAIVFGGNTQNDNDEGVWFTSAAGSTTFPNDHLLALEGAQVPELNPGVVFQEEFGNTFNAINRGFHGSVEATYRANVGPGNFNAILHAGHVIALENDQAIPMTDVLWGELDFPFVSTNLVALGVSLTGSDVNASNDSAIGFAPRLSPDLFSTLQLLVREGDATPVGGNYGILSQPSVSPTSNFVAFRAFIQDLFPITEGIFIGSHGFNGSIVNSLVLDGDDAVGNGDTEFSSFGQPVLTNDYVVFKATTNGTVSTESRTGIWRKSIEGDGLDKLVLQDDPVGNTSFSNLIEDPVVSPEGHIAFKAFTSTNFQGVFRKLDAAPVATVAIEGQPVPGMAAGVNFDSFGEIAINNHQEVAFIADVVGPGINDSNNTGIWIDHPFFGIELVAREGMMIPDQQGINRTITLLDFGFVGGGSSGGKASGLNNVSHIVFRAFFDDFAERIVHVNLFGQVLGDMNGDGEVNLLDVGGFVNAVQIGIFDSQADINGDGKVNLLDTKPFVLRIASGQ